MTTSPQPPHNFESIPVLATGPYNYGVGRHKTNIDVPLSDANPMLSAGPNSVLRAQPDSSPTVQPDEHDKDGQKVEESAFTSQQSTPAQES
jgi:cytochrome c oxidase subunit 1